MDKEILIASFDKIFKIPSCTELYVWISWKSTNICTDHGYSEKIAPYNLYKCEILLLDNYTYPIDNLRCSNDAMLSPVQCAAYLPVPKELLLVKIKGLI